MKATVPQITIQEINELSVKDRGRLGAGCA